MNSPSISSHISIPVIIVVVIHNKIPDDLIALIWWVRRSPVDVDEEHHCNGTVYLNF